MITTERLILRRFTKDDETAYAEIITKESTYRYLGTGSPIPREMVGRMMDNLDATWGHGLGVYAVVERESGKLMGHSGVRGLPCGRKEILYAFDEDFWGKGYATEAAKAALAAHDHRPLIGLSYPENAGSVAVLKKAGFTHVGQEEMFGKTLELFILE